MGWKVQRLGKYENKMFYNGSYDDEETAAHASDTLARKLMQNGEQNHKLNFPDDRTVVYHREGRSSKFIGVCYYKRDSRWKVQRFDKNENKLIYNGYYSDEEIAARASDTLARKLMRNSEQEHKLNFPDDRTEVLSEKKSFKFIGVYYIKDKSLESKWRVQRFNKCENKWMYNGSYGDEETAARASDTLARQLMQYSEQVHKLNFPHERAEVYRKKSSKFIGAQTSRTNENKSVHNAYYDDKETTANASDTLSKKFMNNNEQIYKLKLPEDHTDDSPKNQKKKRKRPKNFSLDYIQNN